MADSNNYDLAVSRMSEDDRNRMAANHLKDLAFGALDHLEKVYDLMKDRDVENSGSASSYHSHFLSSKKQLEPLGLWPSILDEAMEAAQDGRVPLSPVDWAKVTSDLGKGFDREAEESE